MVLDMQTENNPAPRPGIQWRELSTHTPGPWSLCGKVNHETHPVMVDWRQDVIGPPDPSRAGSSLVVATIINRDSPQGEANAALIAAAPDLLAALVACKAAAENQSLTPSARLELVRDYATPAIVLAGGNV
jgi:hypothetical protein